MTPIIILLQDQGLQSDQLQGQAQSRDPVPRRVPAVALAVTRRSRSGSCCEPLIFTGTRTASNAPAATAGWARWARRYTRGRTCFFVDETICGLYHCMLSVVVFKHINQS